MNDSGANLAVERLKQSAGSHQLVAVVGTGASIALTKGKIPTLSWRGLIRNGFEYCEKKGRMTATQAKEWLRHLDSDDLDEILGAAEFIGRKLDSPNGDLYARWLEDVVRDIRPSDKGMENALSAIHSRGIPICTLNYDTLLEKTTNLTSITMDETSRVLEWMRRESEGILHLHGVWNKPSTCILGIRDYETTVGDQVRDLIQRALGSFSRLLFIGCGDTFADPNFSALTKWLRKQLKAATPQHYALVVSHDEAVRHADTSWQGFVDPVPFGNQITDLSGFLLKLFPTVRATPRRARNTRSSNQADISAILKEYRSFLIKDCGQMTIEGLRADMDTAQRRFDLEKLFVPLKVLPTPPEIPPADPARDQKLLNWHEKNKDARAFGQVFGKKRGLALLALPGGGKSLLLKRLAVAYADPSRREKSDDELPDLDLTPLMLRCREWKDYITQPIPSLI